MNPVNWWHRQEGGKIAQERPAPPGADQAYPNLATVPARPEPPDKDAMRKLTDSLIADRTNAQHAAQSAPLADPSSPSASPSLFGVGTAPPPPPVVTTTEPPGGAAAASTPAASASVPAVTAPPAPATPPSAAPRKPVQSAPLSEAAPAPAAAASAAPLASASPPAAAAQPQPALPPGPPPRPAVAGSPPPPAPVPGPAMPAAGKDATTIVFVAGSSALSQPAAAEVKAFAAKRGKAIISVTGYGDSTSGDPAAQSAAVTLGLSRAQQIFTALRAAGVPAEAIRVNAEASGRGAALRLLQ